MLLKRTVYELSTSEWHEFIAGVLEDVEKEIGML